MTVEENVVAGGAGSAVAEALAAAGVDGARCCTSGCPTRSSTTAIRRRCSRACGLDADGIARVDRGAFRPSRRVAGQAGRVIDFAAPDEPPREPVDADVDPRHAVGQRRAQPRDRPGRHPRPALSARVRGRRGAGAVDDRDVRRDGRAARGPQGHAHVAAGAAARGARRAGRGAARRSTGLRGLLDDLVARLDAPGGRIELAFPLFVRKTAPVSGVASLLDYEVRLAGELAAAATHSIVTVAVPVTSLCPCSKEIAEYGAHNQRSTITISVRPREPVRVARAAAHRRGGGVVRALRHPEARRREVRDRARVRQPALRRGPGPRRRGAARRRPARRRLRGRGRELRVDPQPLGFRAHRARACTTRRPVAPGRRRSRPVVARPRLRVVGRTTA